MASNQYPVAPVALRRWRRWKFGGHRWHSDYWESEISKDPAGKKLVMTISLLLGEDREVRMAMEPIRTVSGYDSNAYDYLPLLDEEPELDFRYSLGEPTSRAGSLSISLANGPIDAATLIQRGRILAGHGEVALQVDGGDHDERFVLMLGAMDAGPTFGNKGSGRIALALTDPKETGDVALTPWTLDSERWPNIHDSAVGERVPLVINQYARVPARPVATTAGAVDYLVTHGHGWTINTTTGVRINGEAKTNGDAEYAWSQVETHDALGVPVTLVRFSEPSSTKFDFSEDVRVTVTGGIGADNVVDAIRYLVLGFTTLGRAGVSDVLFSRALARLGHKEVRCLFNGASSADAGNTQQAIEQELLKGFPMISMGWFLGGYGPVVTDRRDSYVAAELTANQWPLQGHALTDMQETATADLYNQFTLRYNYDAEEGSFGSVVTRHSGNNVLCQVSEELIGTRSMSPLESVFIYDDGEAAWVVDWLVEHRALPSYYIEYPAFPWALFNLVLGDNVKITDSRFGLSSQVATVERIAYRRGQVVLGLRCWVRYWDLGGGAATGSNTSAGN